MKALRRFWKRLISPATKRRDEARLRVEIEEHLALLTAGNIRAGLPPDEARRQAALQFGGVEAIKESYRDQRGLPLVETVTQEMRHALRRLRNAPAFTISTVLTLALGIGPTTSIFTLMHAVLLKSLPVANPADLYRLGKVSRCCYYGGYSQDKEFSLVSYDLYKYLRDNTKGFGELAAFSAVEPLLGVRRAGNSEAAQSFPGEFVSGNYFTMFGIQGYAGRVFSASDDRAGARPVAVMSYRLWRRRYGSEASVIGSVFNLNDIPFTVVGIAPPAFFGDTLRNDPPDFFLPLNTEPLLEGDLYTVDNHWLDLIGRLQPGEKPAPIEAEMRVGLRQWLLSHWSDMTANERAKLPAQTLFLSPGGAGISSMREEYEHWLEILMMVSGFVLLIVCANVANLMLVRGMERRRQVSLSMALGAPASRLMWQSLTESILLSLAGGLVGLGIAFAVTRLILHYAFAGAGGATGMPIQASPSMLVLLFAFGVSLIAAVVFGIVPAWMATRVDPIEVLRGASRSTVRTTPLYRKTLVVLQAALSLVLLSTSGLLTSALDHIENEHFGFDRERRIVTHMDPRLGGYKPVQLTPLFERIQDTVSRIPGVSAVALCLYSPLGGNNWGAGVFVDGHPAPGPNDDVFAFWDRVTAGYFGVIGNPILRGRGILNLDMADARHVAVVNEAFARKFFKNEDPIGRHFGQHGIGSEREYEIVGIAKDARYLDFDLDKPIAPFFFLPEAQHDILPKPGSPDGNPGSHYLHDIVIVTRPGASLSLAQVRQAMAAVDPNLPVISIRTLKDQVTGQFRQQRLIAWLASLFGVFSLILAAVGLYGVTAYNAGRRTNEIGVRMALGAGRTQVVALILRGALALIVIGLLTGLPVTFVAGRFLGHQLYGLPPYNPVVTFVAVVTLGLSALVASLIPALRASLISPQEALRSE
jgi:predicted permease